MHVCWRRRRYVSSYFAIDWQKGTIPPTRHRGNRALKVPIRPYKLIRPGQHRRTNHYDYKGTAGIWWDVCWRHIYLFYKKNYFYTCIYYPARHSIYFLNNSSDLFVMYWYRRLRVWSLITINVLRRINNGYTIRLYSGVLSVCKKPTPPHTRYRRERSVGRLPAHWTDDLT